jgi:hypothetical protein
LPYREIAVLQRRWRQASFLAAHGRAVQGAQLVGQHPHRPAVGDDVVCGEQQHMLAIGKLEQQCPDQWSMPEIEGLGVLLGQHPVQLVPAWARRVG